MLEKKEKKKKADVRGNLKEKKYKNIPTTMILRLKPFFILFLCH